MSWKSFFTNNQSKDDCKNDQSHLKGQEKLALQGDIHGEFLWFPSSYIREVRSFGQTWTSPATFCLDPPRSSSRGGSRIPNTSAVPRFPRLPIWGQEWLRKPKGSHFTQMKLVDLPTVKLEYRCLVLDGFCRILSWFLPNSPRPPWIMLASFIHPCTCHLIISPPSLQPKRHRA